MKRRLSTQNWLSQSLGSVGKFGGAIRPMVDELGINWWVRAPKLSCWTLGTEEFCWGMSCWIVSIGTMIWPITIPFPQYLKTPDLLDPIIRCQTRVSGWYLTLVASIDAPLLVTFGALRGPIIRHGTGMGPWYQGSYTHTLRYMLAPQFVNFVNLVNITSTRLSMMNWRDSNR